MGMIKPGHTSLNMEDVAEDLEVTYRHISKVPSIGPDATGKIICGGPMMGRAMVNIDMPANKRVSGLLLLDEQESKRATVENCIRCGKCVKVCPMGLEPYLLAKQSELSRWEDMEKHQVMDCIDCGCCQFTCPSNRPLLDYIRVGKATVGGIIRSRAAK